LSSQPNSGKYEHVHSGMTAGFEHAGAVGLFVFFGLALDRLFDTQPFMVIMCTVIGFVAGFLRLFYHREYEASRQAMQGTTPAPQRQPPEVLRARSRAARNTSMFQETGKMARHFVDWKPRRFGAPLPDELQDTAAAARFALSKKDASAQAEVEVAAAMEVLQCKPEGGKAEA